MLAGCRWCPADCLLLWDTVCNQRLRTASRASCQFTGPPSRVCGGFQVGSPLAHQGRPNSGGLRAPALGMAGSKRESAPAECRWAADPSPAPRTAPAQGHPAGLGLGFLVCEPGPGMGRPWSQGEEGVGCPAVCQQGAAGSLRRPGVGAGSARGRTAPAGGAGAARRVAAAAAAAGRWQRGRVRGRRRRLGYLRTGRRSR